MATISELTFVLDQAPWPAFLVDDSGMVRRVNAAAAAVLGTVMEGEPSLSAGIWSPANESTAEEFLARQGRSSVLMVPLKFRVKGGASHSFSTYVSPFARDGKRFHLFQLLPGAVAAPATPAGEPAPTVDAAAAHKQKLDCALQLIRTVSLDFNNALTTILGHTSLVLTRMEPSHPWRGSLVEVEKSAEKAAEIAQDLAEFSRQEKDVRTQAPGNLNAVLRRAVELFQRPELSRLAWTLQLEKRLYTAIFDEAKMQQAFLRVMENAVEAMGGEGRVAVRTLNHSFDAPVMTGNARLAAGHYVCVEVSDTGCGIPPEVQPRIFEPFFTTKNDPQHRGLGLAWVYGIVTNHGGVVAVQSQPGSGTVVRIFLPAQQKIVRDSGTKLEDLRGHQTILMVDDEEMLLNLGQTVLSAFGYKVITANGGARALELFGQSGGKIHLVITDLVMPGMSGRELVEQLRKVAPRVPILCTSGYLRSATETGDDHYLRKPFTSQELLRKVKQLLLQSGGA